MPDGTQLDGTYVYAEWTYENSQKLDLSKFPTETGFIVYSPNIKIDKKTKTKINERISRNTLLKPEYLFK